MPLRAFQCHQKTVQGSINKYINYVSTVRRYSPRTIQIYTEVLERFAAFLQDDPSNAMTPSMIRSFEVELLGKQNLDERTVNLYLSVLSGYAKFLIKEGVIASNPIKLVSRPKTEKRLPVFYREESMQKYFDSTQADVSEDALSLLLPAEEGKMDKVTKEVYSKRLSRAIISTLVSTGIRRSEIISLKVSNLDFSRKVMSVRGKGDKMREIPLVDALCIEIKLYLKALKIVFGEYPDNDDPLFVTPSRGPLYPMFVDRTVKEAFDAQPEITGKKSPHVLRHTLATELLNDGADLNSIKEMLGHSSLAATQVYTHNSIEKLKAVYTAAHPRSSTKK